MDSISLEEIKETRIIKFCEELVPVNERVAVVDFKDMEDLIRECLIFRIAVYCFLIVEDGSATIEINGLTKRIVRGDLVCGIPGDIWNWENIDNLKGRFILFEAPFLVAVLKGNFTLEPVSFLNSDYHYPFISLSEKRFKKLNELSEEILESLNEEPVFYDLIRCQLWQFVFLAEKEYIANGNGGRKLSNTNFIPVFINLVNKFFKTSHDTGFYAEKMNITPNYLNKIVKGALGITPRQFIQNRVISEAKVLLRLTDISVSELAYKLGFNDPNYFIRCFKNSEGLPPKEYQKLGTL